MVKKSVISDVYTPDGDRGCFVTLPMCLSFPPLPSPPFPSILPVDILLLFLPPHSSTCLMGKILHSSMLILGAVDLQHETAGKQSVEQSGIKHSAADRKPITIQTGPHGAGGR